MTSMELTLNVIKVRLYAYRVGIADCCASFLHTDPLTGFIVTDTHLRELANWIRDGL